jgi:hypothetical protein
MFQANHVGHTPVLDLDSSIVTRTSGAVSQSIGTGMLPCLETQALGGDSEAFLRGSYETVFTFSTANYAIAWAIALCPYSSLNIADTPIFLDYSINLMGYMSTSALQIFPWIGLMNSSSIAAGWDANNNCSDFMILPCTINDRQMSAGGQVLWKDIVSGSYDEDKYVGVGFGIYDFSGTASFNNLNFNISARYQYNPVCVATGG